MVLKQFVTHLSLTSSHLHPLQVENCDSNSPLVVNDDDNGILRLENVIDKLYYLVDLPLIFML